MYDPVKDSQLYHQRFYKRLKRNFLWALALLFFSMGIGMLGYHHFEDFSWVDSYANAAMILSGMGPLNPLKTTSGKLFAGSYALYSGLTFIFSMGLIFAPIFHRFLHKFHLEEAEKAAQPKQSSIRKE